MRTHITVIIVAVAGTLVMGCARSVPSRTVHLDSQASFRVAQASAGQVGCSPSQIEIANYHRSARESTWVARCGSASFVCSRTSVGSSCAAARGSIIVASSAPHPSGAAVRASTSERRATGSVRVRPNRVAAPARVVGRADVRTSTAERRITGQASVRTPAPVHPPTLTPEPAIEERRVVGTATVRTPEGTRSVQGEATLREPTAAERRAARSLLGRDRAAIEREAARRGINLRFDRDE